MIFILVKIEYGKNAQKCPKMVILGLFQLIASSKQPIKGFFDTQDPPKMYQVGHLNGIVIVWEVIGDFRGLISVNCCNSLPKREF